MDLTSGRRELFKSWGRQTRPDLPCTRLAYFMLDGKSTTFTPTLQPERTLRGGWFALSNCKSPLAGSHTATHRKPEHTTGCALISLQNEKQGEVPWQTKTAAKNRWESSLLAAALAVEARFSFFNETRLPHAERNVFSAGDGACRAGAGDRARGQSVARPTQHGGFRAVRNRKKDAMSERDRGINPAVSNGGALILAGVLLLLDQLNIISFNFWALVFMIGGVVKLVQSCEGDSECSGSSSIFWGDCC